ncbi:MAG TPA: hypothetical protein EYN06_05575 [Myxococcales bacterium]|nr:hypothetical protein [Myxococcales bacterium]
MAQPTQGWTLSAELLFDDALRLFALGDSDGALISLERLLTSSELNEDLTEFVQKNEVKLLRVYEEVLGPWNKTLHLNTSGESLHAGFLRAPKIKWVIGKVDGQATIGDLLQNEKLSQLETVAVISQLLRSKAVSSHSAVQ